MPKQKILLVYIGNEQGSWGAVSYPRPAHYYVMPGILYCAQSLMSDPWICGQYDVSCGFFNTTVQSTEEILSLVMEHGPTVIGFSVFCWNAAETFRLVRELKSRNPECRIIGGGPEVSLKNALEAAAFFSKNPGFDLLVFGEAETKIAALVKTAVVHDNPLPPAATGYAFSPGLGGAAEFTKDFLEDGRQIPSIYPFSLDIKRSAGCGLAMVYETGRGCPYRCIYCQFSHRNHKPYRFSPDRIKRELAWLFGQGIECIHFADAVFDIDPGFAKDILAACLSMNRTTSLFFYCSFYRLDDELAELFSASGAQICVGIQTTNPRVLAKINRSLSPRLFHDIAGILAKHSLNFYVDLIFGLPLDNIESFRKSFSDALVLGPSFIMVFPLTLIKGTVLEQQAKEYGMTGYAQTELEKCGLMCDIEYRNIALYRDFSLRDLSSFDDLALALFYFYNRFRMSLSYLEKRCGPDAARLYENIGKKTKAFLGKTGQAATNTNFISGFEHEIKAILVSEATAAGAKDLECAAFEEIFKLDIFGILMTNAPQREKLFLNSPGKRPPHPEAGRAEISEESLVRRIAPGKAVTTGFRLSDLTRLHVLRDTIEPGPDTVFVCAPFSRWDNQVFAPSHLEKFLLETIPVDKPVKFRHLAHSVRRAFAALDHGGNHDAAIRDALAMLADRDIISV
jgi:radical SAM superfamily enzyme YgiQ (UPF0313 family)